MTNLEQNPHGFLTTDGVYVPADRTARNAEDLHGWTPLYKKSEQAINDSSRLKGLRELCGYIENGGGQSVSICQDDATKDWCVSVDHKHYVHGNSFTSAIDAALDKSTDLRQELKG